MWLISELLTQLSSEDGPNESNNLYAVQCFFFILVNYQKISDNDLRFQCAKVCAI